MFYWDNGLFIAKPHLAVDLTRRQACGFISHAHADHMARHELTLCTVETASLYQHRLGKRNVKILPYLEPVEWGGVMLTLYPAGHCLGSAMLQVEDDGKTLLYTGDFKFGTPETSQEIVIPKSDILIMETTFGDPKYRFPDRKEVIQNFLALVKETFDNQQTPVIHAYSLGKAQEVTKILTNAGFRVQQHPVIFEISRIYGKHGIDLGDVIPVDPNRKSKPDRVLIVPPRVGFLETSTGPVTFAVTGWAMDASAKYRYGVDHTIPLSDHADYGELIEMVKCVEPEITYCTHGSNDFVDRLYDLGINARPLDRPWQKRLF